MKICSGEIRIGRFDHVPIVFDVKDCPLCEKELEVQRLQGDIENQRNEIEALKNLVLKIAGNE